MRSNACQFRGIKQTLAAYQANDVVTWSIKNGPLQCLFKYNGTDADEGYKQLEATLKMMLNGSSTATYTLCVYEDWKDGEKIKNNTPYDSSFNFVLFEDEQDQPYNQRKAAYVMEMDERLNRMEAMIKNLTEHEGEEEDSQVSGIQKVVAGILTHPQIMQAIAGKVVGFIENIGPMNTIGRVAGVIAPEQEQQEVTEQNRKTAEFSDIWNALPVPDQYRISNALTILLKSDSKFPEHVERLADMSINNQATYKMALKFL